jgi:hypothetical protein
MRHGNVRVHWRHEEPHVFPMDNFKYCAPLPGGGELPAVVSFSGKLEPLLARRVLRVPSGRLVFRWIGSHASLGQAPGAKAYLRELSGPILRQLRWS